MRPSTEVVKKVASKTGHDPTELPPLHTAVDPDALNDIFSSISDSAERPEAVITFSYAGYRIRVTQNEEVTVE